MRGVQRIEVDDPHRVSRRRSSQQGSARQHGLDALDDDGLDGQVVVVGRPEGAAVELAEFAVLRTGAFRVEQKSFVGGHCLGERLDGKSVVL